jgi:L-alanine-DL-glutamate epimerase-like enolase superfamily enzyme
MKIVRVRTHIARLPADEPLADGAGVPGTTRDHVVLKLWTNDDIDGIGVAFFGGPILNALKAACDDLGALVVGEDAARPERVAEKLRSVGASTGAASFGGIFTLALSAIDMALWDIKGKSVGLPLSRLLGGHRDAVPAYASGALMRHQSLDDTMRAARLLIERGWGAVKTQLALPGETTPAQEVERIRLIRETIGPDVRLMCDINQRWRIDEAISIGNRLEPYHLHWLEDVISADDYAGIAEVRRKIATPIAAGEYVFGMTPFRHMLEARAVDFVMIDPYRVGGITQWMKVAGMAEAFNLPVVSHLIPELQVHLIAAIPNGHIVEYMPWSTGLFEDPPVPDRGMMKVPRAPGLGLTFTREIEAALG